MDYRMYDDAFDFISKLATIGAIAIMVSIVLLPIGYGVVGWWAWNNVEVRVVGQEESHE